MAEILYPPQWIPNLPGLSGNHSLHCFTATGVHMNENPNAWDFPAIKIQRRVRVGNVPAIGESGGWLGSAALPSAAGAEGRQGPHLHGGGGLEVVQRRQVLRRHLRPEPVPQPPRLRLHLRTRRVGACHRRQPARRGEEAGTFWRCRGTGGHWDLRQFEPGLRGHRDDR